VSNQEKRPAQTPSEAQFALKRRTDETGFVAERPGAASSRQVLALLLDTDLFFSVKVTVTLKHVGYATKTLRRPEDFAAALVGEQPTLALVNTGARGLDWRSGIAAAVAAGVPVVAFGSHVDLQTQLEARDLGATSVIANSKLASDLPGVVARALDRDVQRTHSTQTSPHTSDQEGM